jgi:hypothetical protein
MKLLYADTWMIEALKAANKTTAVLLDLPALVSTLSLQDVAFYLDVNKNLAAFLPKALVSSFQSPEFKLQGWLSEKQVKQVEDLLEARRLTNKKVTPDEAHDASKVLTIDILDDDTLLVHYIDRTTETFSSERDKAMWESKFGERVLRQMSAFMKFEAIAVLPIMRWYLKAREVVLTPNTVV